MLSRLFLFIILFISTVIIGEERQKIKQTEIKVQRIVTTQNTVANLPKTFTPQQTDNATKVRKVDVYLPWILAFIVSLIAVFTNITLAKRFRVSYQENIKQLNENLVRILQETNEENVNIQLEKIEQHFQKQDERIDYLMRISNLSMQRNNNRLEWLREVTLCISNYMTQVSYIKPEMKDFFEAREFKMIVEKTLFYKSKVEILLTEKNYDEKQVILAMQEFSEVLTVENMNFDDELYSIKRDNLVAATRRLFKNHHYKT